MYDNTRKYLATHGEGMSFNWIISNCLETFPFAKGFIEDYVLEFRENININKSSGSRVPVVIWNTTKNDLANIELGNNALYQRDIVKVQVTSVNDKFADFGVRHYRAGIDAEVFQMVGVLKAEQEPSNEHYSDILQGYHDHKLKTKPLSKALISSKR